MLKHMKPDEVIRATATLHEIKVIFPGDVEGCHQQIENLKELLVATRGLVSDRDSEIESLRDEVSNLEDELSAERHRADDTLVDRVNDLLDACERTGVRTYVLPQSDRAARAIVGLFDVAGRMP